jgi:hypothetical protein
MQQLHPSHGSRLRRVLRHPIGRFEGQPQFARQIDAALRLAPAEAYRGHSAVLLSCGDADDVRRAEAALRERWPVDAVHAVQCPIQSWTDALDGAPGAGSWLQHWLLREIHRRDPTLLAIVDRGRRAGDEETRALHALIALLRGWGVTTRIVALRVDDGNGARAGLPPSADADGQRTRAA